jgi:hypothetical protein
MRRGTRLQHTTTAWLNKLTDLYNLFSPSGDRTSVPTSSQTTVSTYWAHSNCHRTLILSSPSPRRASDAPALPVPLRLVSVTPPALYTLLAVCPLSGCLSSASRVTSAVHGAASSRALRALLRAVGDASA